MPKITIEIPEEMDPAQQADLTAWIEHQVELASPKRYAFEDDPEWQASTSAAIKRGMADVEAGRVMGSAELRSRIDEKLGFNRPG